MIAAATLLALTPVAAASPKLSAILSQFNIAADVVSTGAQPTHSAADAAKALGLKDASTVVKSLVLTATSGTPLLVLASGCARLDMTKIGEYANCRVRLATPAEVYSATSHVIGEVPPLCAGASDTLKVLMDANVLNLGETIYAGAGEPGLHLKTNPQDLLRASSAVVGDFCANDGA